jgi:hypothetical protein
MRSAVACIVPLKLYQLEIAFDTAHGKAATNELWAILEPLIPEFAPSPKPLSLAAPLMSGQNVAVGQGMLRAQLAWWAAHG